MIDVTLPTLFIRRYFVEIIRQNSASCHNRQLGNFTQVAEPFYSQGKTLLQPACPHGEQEKIMTNFKPLLIGGFFFWLCIVIAYASVQIFRGTDPALSWIGLNLTALPLLAFFTGYLRNSDAAAKSKTLGFTLVSGLGLVICMAVSYRYGTAAGIMHVWAGLTFIGWVLFVRLSLTRRSDHLSSPPA